MLILTVGELRAYLRNLPDEAEIELFNYSDDWGEPSILNMESGSIRYVDGKLAIKTDGIDIEWSDDNLHLYTKESELEKVRIESEIAK